MHTRKMNYKAGTNRQRLQRLFAVLILPVSCSSYVTNAHIILFFFQNRYDMCAAHRFSTRHTKPHNTFIWKIILGGSKIEFVYIFVYVNIRIFIHKHTNMYMCTYVKKKWQATMFVLYRVRWGSPLYASSYARSLWPKI